MTSSGVIMNNEMDDFSTPGQPNGYGLHPSVAKRVCPLHANAFSPIFVLTYALPPPLTPTAAISAPASGLCRRCRRRLR